MVFDSAVCEQVEHSNLGHEVCGGQGVSSILTSEGSSFEGRLGHRFRIRNSKGDIREEVKDRSKLQ
eukprot:UN18040